MIATPKRWASPDRAARGRALALLLVFAAVAWGRPDSAAAHRTKVPHQLVLTQVAVENDSLRISVWMERPTPVVVREFRATFVDDRQRATDQDAQFRRAKWQEMNDAVFVLVDREPLELPLRPLPLPHNGRGDAQKFVYAVGAAVPLSLFDGADRIEIDLDNQLLLDQPHVFLSAYAEATRPWKVVEDSNREVLARGERAGSEIGGSGSTWTHDERVRSWHLVFERPPGRR